MFVLLNLLICTSLRAHIIFEALYKINNNDYYNFLNFQHMKVWREEKSFNKTIQNKDCKYV